MFGITGKNKKQIVGLTITPNLGLEAIVCNKNFEVVKYCQKPLEYNIASREIQDINAFRSTVLDIFNELNINQANSNVFLVLPNVHFGFRSIEESLADDETIESMILSDSQESYIFKQEEPQSAWVDINARTGSPTKYIAHSSIQRRVVDEIQDAIMDIGATIIGIEGATTAIPRGIALTGRCDDVIENHKKWNILLVNPNNYSIFQMSGNRILDYVEVPFAIMSFEGDEVYSALSSAVSQYLPNYPASKLVIVSQTDNVSARALNRAIIFEGEVVAFESNKFATEPPAPITGDVIKQTSASMSLGALGASSPKFEDFATLNVLGDMNYDGIVSYGTMDFIGKEREVTSETIAKFSVTSSVILILLLLLIGGSLFGFDFYFKNQLTEITEKVNTINSEIEVLNKKLKGSIVALIKLISSGNKQAVNYYDSLSTDIPQHVWLTYYINRNGKDVGIEGFSMEIRDIYEYYKSLKVLAPNSDIKLNKLEVFKETKDNNGASVDQIVLNDDNRQQAFAFQISNTTYQKSFDTSGNRVKIDASGAAQNNNAEQSGAATTAPAAQNQNAADTQNPSSPPPQIPDVSNSSLQSYGTRIPNVQDVEINLKEIK